jgi:uncharacterized protein YjbJ (UPF0337 family)
VEQALVQFVLCLGFEIKPSIIGELAMSSTTDKIKGLANEAAGNVKQATGKLVGNEKLQAKGVIQERKGEAEQAVGKAKDSVKKVIDRA